MRRIIKRMLTTDPSGRVLSGNTERLGDDGRGVIHVAHRNIAVFCQGCRRPLTELSELRGRCHYCRIRSCCVHCETQCCACARRLCWACRRGFAGQTPATACPTCQVSLFRRQAYLDRLVLEGAMFNRSIQRQQSLQRMYSLDLQATRDRAHSQLGVIREWNRLRAALARTWGRVGRSR